MKSLKKSINSESIPYVIGAILFVAIMSRGVLATEAKAVNALEVQGWTDVEIIEHAWFGVGLRGCST